MMSVEMPVVTLALLVLVEVEEVNVNLVLDMVVEVEVEVVEVHAYTVDEVEVLAFGAVKTEHLMLPLLVDVLDDADANHEVDGEADVKIDLLGVAEYRVVDVEVLLEKR
eukprot:1394684-Amphidinium_carterae.2